jgi:hypothetical protein
MTETTVDESMPMPMRPAPFWRTRNVVLALALVLTVALTVGGGYWLTHPRALAPYGDALGGPAPRGRVFSDVMVFSSAHEFLTISDAPADRRVLTVTSLAPRIEENTAGAVFVFMVCRSKSNPEYILGAVPESPASSCSQWHRLRRSERLSFGDPYTRVIAQITTSKAGRIHLAGYDIAYREGIRRGHQHVGIDSTFTIP